MKSIIFLPIVHFRLRCDAKKTLEFARFLTKMENVNN